MTEIELLTQISENIQALREIGSYISGALCAFFLVYGMDRLLPR